MVCGFDGFQRENAKRAQESAELGCWNAELVGSPAEWDGVVRLGVCLSQLSLACIHAAEVNIDRSRTIDDRGHRVPADRLIQVPPVDNVSAALSLQLDGSVWTNLLDTW